MYWGVVQHDSGREKNPEPEEGGHSLNCLWISASKEFGGGLGMVWG